MVQHCISSIRKRTYERLYKAYVTDVMKAMAEMIASLGGGHLSLPRWYELDEKRGKPPKEERTADEIINDIFTKLGELE